MIEAMACGTPILAFHCGSVPEVVEDGLTGRVVSSMVEAVQALPEVLALDRVAVRRRFEQRFSAERMGRNYAKVYRALLHKVRRAGVPGPELHWASKRETSSSTIMPSSDEALKGPVHTSGAMAP
jgi:hypothetical protein